MTKREAYREGYVAGLEAAEDMPDDDVIADRSDNRVCECQDRPDEEPEFCADCLTASAQLAEQNARQYAGSPFCTGAFRAKDEAREEALYDAYDAGVAAGIKAGVKARLAGGVR